MRRNEKRRIDDYEEGAGPVLRRQADGGQHPDAGRFDLHHVCLHGKRHGQRLRRGRGLYACRPGGEPARLYEGAAAADGIFPGHRHGRGSGQRGGDQSGAGPAAGVPGGI